MILDAKWDNLKNDKKFLKKFDVLASHMARFHGDITKIRKFVTPRPKHVISSEN